jgi:hypothetical protein
MIDLGRAGGSGTVRLICSCKSASISGLFPRSIGDVVVGYDWQQRPEDLVLHHRHILGHVLQDVHRHAAGRLLLRMLDRIDNRDARSDAEACFEYITVIATRFPRNTEPVLGSGVHFLSVEPFVVRHRRIVSVSTNGHQKRNTEHR